MSQYRIFLVKAVANSNALNAALAFSEQNLLEEIVTTLAFNPKSNLAQILNVLPEKIGNNVRDELSRRTWIVSSSGFIHQHSTKEVIRVLAYRYLKPLLNSSVKESLKVTTSETHPDHFSLTDQSGAKNNY